MTIKATGTVRYEVYYFSSNLAYVSRLFFPLNSDAYASVVIVITLLYLMVQPSSASVKIAESKGT